MRRKLCIIAYKLRLRRLAFWLSPSVYCHVMGKEIQKNLRELEPGELSIRDWRR